MSLNTLIPRPDAASVNSGLSPLSQRRMLDLYGAPASTMGDQCATVTAQKLARVIETMDVGPFRATGNRHFLIILKRVFGAVQRRDPELYAALGTAGVLCARRVRGGQQWSNHSWGTAIDIKIGGVLDTRGDNAIQRGLLKLYPYMHAERLYWGTEFKTEDAMHFEMSDELVRDLSQSGGML